MVKKKKKSLKHSIFIHEKQHIVIRNDIHHYRTTRAHDYTKFRNIKCESSQSMSLVVNTYNIDLHQ